MTYGYVGECVPGTNLHFQRNTSALPMDKLQSFWPMRGLGYVDAHSPDLVGNSPLVVRGAVEWEPNNPCGGALGSTSFVDNGTIGLFSAGAATGFAAENRDLQWWMSAWIYSRQLTTETGVLISRAKGGSQRGWYVSVWGPDFTGEGGAAYSAIGFRTSADGSATWNGFAKTDADAVTHNTWQHVVFGHTATTGTGNAFIALNGAAVIQTGAQTAFESDEPITFGMDENGTNEYDGLICDVAYFVGTSGVPTAAQIADLYNGGKGNTLVSG